VVLVDLLESNGTVRQILALDSSFVQLTTHGVSLIVCMLTQPVFCNTGQKTFKEVGGKLRQGGQGVVILGDKIWAARPGCRIWEVGSDTGLFFEHNSSRKP
jgi:hypothetical protein